MIDSNDWKLIDDIFQTAVGLDEPERERYLEKACRGDDRLFGEVESLFRSLGSNSSFLEEPVFDLGLGVLGIESSDDLTGKAVGHYRIRRKLGEGGMGEVYLADDTRLDRQVALKFFVDSLTDDGLAIRQLIKEARAAAMLDHPNICRVYGVEEIGGRGLIVMEFVEGQTLSSAIKKGRIDESSILPVASQIAEALAAAHSSGIIHCDVKPGNIILTKEGKIKVLDFGLAKVVRQNSGQAGTSEISVSAISRRGLIEGTIAYMSPEQLKGERLDFTSDVFSFGTLLCELATGSNPFARTSDAETISGILSPGSHIDPLKLRKLSPGLRTVVRKCLHSDKEARYRSAEEMLLDLTSPSRKTGRLTRIASLIVLVSVLVLLATALLIYWNSKRVYRVAVLPLRNESFDPDLDYISDGVTEGLIGRLSGSDRLQVRPFTMVSGYRSDTLDQVAVGHDLGADLILTGKIQRQDEKLFVESDLFDSARGITVGSWEDELDPSSVLNFENSITERLLMAVPVDKDELYEKKHRGSTTENNEAFRQYWLGRYYWRKRDPQNLQTAITAFQRSIDLDPGYSLPYSGLADCYVLLSLGAYGTSSANEAVTNAKAVAHQALEIDPRDAEAHTSLGIIMTKYDWDWAAAEREFRQAIGINPEYAGAHYWLSDLLAVVGRADEAIKEAEMARRLDPFSSQAKMNLARTYYYSRQYDQAMEILLGAEQTDRVRYMIALIDLQKGLFTEALGIFQEIAANNKPLADPMLGYTYAKLGRRTEAEKVIEELISSSGADQQAQELAFIYIALGNHDKACFYLDMAFHDRHPVLIAVRVEPLFDPLRGDARFDELLKKMSLS